MVLQEPVPLNTKRAGNERLIIFSHVTLFIKEYKNLTGKALFILPLNFKLFITEIAFTIQLNDYSTEDKGQYKCIKYISYHGTEKGL